MGRGFSQEVMEKHLAAFKDRAARRKVREKTLAARRARKREKQAPALLLKIVKDSMKYW